MNAKTWTLEMLSDLRVDMHDGMRLRLSTICKFYSCLPFLAAVAWKGWKGPANLPITIPGLRLLAYDVAVLARWRYDAAGYTEHELQLETYNELLALTRPAVTAALNKTTLKAAAEAYEDWRKHCDLSCAVQEKLRVILQRSYEYGDDIWTCTATSDMLVSNVLPYVYSDLPFLLHSPARVSVTGMYRFSTFLCHARAVRGNSAVSLWLVRKLYRAWSVSAAVNGGTEMKWYFRSCEPFPAYYRPYSVEAAIPPDILDALATGGVTASADLDQRVFLGTLVADVLGAGLSALAGSTPVTPASNIQVGASVHHRAARAVSVGARLDLNKE